MLKRSILILYSSTKMAVHESYLFHITSDKFIIEPRGTGLNELLVIDRVTQEISLTANDGQIPASAITKTIYGIFGIIRLVAGPYLIVVTKKAKVGEIDNHAVWQVVDTEVLSYKRTLFHLNEGQQVHNRTYLSMVEYILKTEYFYFSTTFDLSHTLQRLSNTSPDFSSLDLHERADQRFVWNGHLLRELTQQPELGKYCLPMILGCVFIKSVAVNNKPFDYILFSRRCIYRAGTRLYMRGVDDEGQVANFVETEQIVQYNGNKCSFVQTRGSIPLFWSQRPNLKRIPVPVIYSTKTHVEAFKRHFDDQVYNYGKQVVINLVNQKGYEHPLEKAFAQTVTSVHNENIRYEAFDFHKECSHLRWDRLSILINRLEDERKQFGYFFVQKDGHVVSQQLGVFRTNCMDCLDRTNVVQGMLAREALQEQLTRLEIMNIGQVIEFGSEFDLIYKNVWADHADMISKQYAGTGALKTDFTRTGKRTTSGLLMDGLNSVVRYFKNNFQDGFRQDAIDLFLGNHIVEESEGILEPSPLKTDRDWKYYIVPVIFLIAMAMFVISILLPDEHFTENVMYILFWGAASAITMGVIIMYGQEFVDQPRLTQAKVKTD